MTIQSFDSVFQKISLSVGVKEAFFGTEVKNLTIFKKERVVAVDIISPRLIPFHETEQLKKELQQTLPGIKEVRLTLEYALGDMDEDSFLSSYWDNIKAFISQQSKICAGIMSDASWKYKDGKLLIYVKNNMAYYMAQKKLDIDLQHMIEGETGRAFVTQFKNVSSSDKEVHRLERIKKRKCLKKKRKQRQTNS